MPLFLQNMKITTGTIALDGLISVDWICERRDSSLDCGEDKNS
jgi:hypothetical protein